MTLKWFSSRNSNDSEFITRREMKNIQLSGPLPNLRSSVKYLIFIVQSGRKPIWFPFLKLGYDGSFIRVNLIKRHGIFELQIHITVTLKHDPLKLRQKDGNHNRTQNREMKIKNYYLSLWDDDNQYSITVSIMNSIRSENF